MPERWWLPLSILAAGALSGVGLYLGSRERSAAQSPEAALALSSALPDASVVEVTAPAARTPAQQSVAAQLQKDRARIVARCWEPSLRRTAQPASVTIPLRFTFTADGRQHAYAVGSPSVPERQDVADCVRDLLLEYRVEPSADVSGAHVELTLP